MVDVGYWVETFLSRPREALTLLLTVGVFAYAALVYPDREDETAVTLGGLLLVPLLTFAGPEFVLEWHYWLGGSVLAAAVIILVDTRRQRTPTESWPG